MGKQEPTVDDILRAARQMLEFAQLGARDFRDGGDRRMSGMYNAVTQGRSVTFVLQKLTGREPRFNAWYAKVQSSLKEDPVSRWFTQLRNQIVKEGTHGDDGMTTYISHFDSRTVAALARFAPAGATDYFIGDPQGRSGWNVTLRDGSQTQVFFDLPESVGWSKMTIDGAPDDRPFEELLTAWLGSLDSHVTDAEQRFGGASR